jgi:hypothetical protein
MNRFLKLVHFEMNRFWKLYMVLMGVTILSQIIGVIVTSQSYLNKANQLIYKELMPKNQFIEQYGTMSFSNVSQSLLFLGPIALCVAVLIIYVFFIWYRDWMGKNTFSYRLFMLPTARINVYLAKAATIFLFTLGLVALQLVLLPVESQILQWMVPKEFFTELTMNEITNDRFLVTLFPKSLLDFVLYYGIGMIVVFVVFTAILFERSFRLKGVFIGILYCALSLFIFLAPLLVDAFILKQYFYSLELFFMELGTALLVLAGAIWTGQFLINNKIRA